MKVIRVHQPGGPEVLKLEELPTPTAGEGELLIRLEFIGVNFTDVELRRGSHGLPMPITPGREGAGLIDAVGPGVTGFTVGQRVAYAPIQGAYAEYALIPAAQAVAVPEGMEPNLAAAVMLQGMTAHYLCTSTYPLKAGESCLVHAGAGGMGLMLIQMCKMIGATVYTTVSTEEKAERVREAGADHVIFYTQVDFEEEVNRLAGKNNLDVVYDAVGQTTFAKGLKLLRPRGMMALYGAASGKVEPFDPQILSANGSLFITRPALSHYLLTRQELEWRAGEVMDWVNRGKIDVRIESTFPLAEVAAAHEALEGRRTTGKLLLIP